MLKSLPSHLSEGDLSRFVDGDATVEIVEHVGQCKHCADTVETLRDIGAALDYLSEADRCPTTETLIAFADGDLDDALTRRVELHLVGCRACKGEIALYRQFAAAADSVDVSVTALPSPGMEDTRVGRTEPAAGPSPFTWSFIPPRSQLAPQPIVVRGNTDTTWHDIGEYRVRFSVERDSRPLQRYRLNGALAGTVSGPVTVHLWQADALVATTVAEDFSGLPYGAGADERTLRFNFADLASGDYSLSFALDGLDLRLTAPIHIGEGDT